MTDRTAEAPPGWNELPTEAGLAALAHAARLLAEGGSSQGVGAALRREGLPPERVSAILTQLDLRARGAAKFDGLAAEMLFTRAGLEQATRARVAALHAERFVSAGCSTVADLGCGLGAESMAFIAAGLGARPVELDPLTAAFAEHNLAVAAHAGREARSALAEDASDGERGDPSAARGPRVLVGDAERIGPGDAAGVFLDPARRTAGHSDTRRVAAHDYSPSLEFSFGLAARRPAGVKLGPGFEREAIPDEAEAQWVSVDGQLVETGLWFGAAARPGVRRAALVLRGDDPAAELVSESDADDAAVAPLGEFLYEPDGAVIRARLIGMLAAELGAGMLSEGIAYLTGDALVPTPFARAFRVLERLPMREKELRKALAQRGIGRLEIKKRGADVDPAALRSKMRLRGERTATLFLTRESGRHVALLAERC